MNPDDQPQEITSGQGDAEAVEQGDTPPEQSPDVVEEALSPREKFLKLSRGEATVDGLSDDDKAEIIIELRKTTWYVDPVPYLFPDDPKGDDQAKVEKLVALKEVENA